MGPMAQYLRPKRSIRVSKSLVVEPSDLGILLGTQGVRPSSMAMESR